MNIWILTMTLSRIENNPVKNRRNIQSMVANIWEKVLELDDINIDDEFFLLGGSSLKAFQIVLLMEKELQVKIPATAIFTNNTIRKLAHYLENISFIKQKTLVESFSQQNEFELMNLQEGYYFFQQSNPDSAYVYNLSIILDFTGDFNLGIFKKSLNELIKKHKALQTVISQHNGRPFQRFNCNYQDQLNFLVVDCIQDELMTITKKEMKKVIPLDGGTLLKLCLLKIKGKSDFHRVILSIPHIIADGWSLNLLRKQLCHLYFSFLENKIPILDGGDYAYTHHLIESLSKNKEKYAGGLRYWINKLKGYQEVNFPYDYQQKETVLIEGKRTSLDMSSQDYFKIKNFCKKHNISEFMFFAGVLNVFLNRLCYQNDLVIGFPISGRNIPGSENIVGLFTNSLVLRTKISENENFISLLEQVKKNCVEAYQNQGVAFNEIVKALNIERDLKKNPIFQIMLVWQDWDDSVELKHNKTSINTKAIDNNTSKFDFIFEFTPKKEGLQGYFEYNTGLFHENTVETILKYFLDLIKSLMRSPEQQLTRVKFGHNLTKPFEQQSYNHLNTEARIPIRIFENHAKDHKKQTALIYGETRINYKELNEKANKLANFILHHYGISKNNHIAIYMDRNIDVIVAMLAVLKVGGVYVPIDIKSPTERVKYILADSSCSLIITNNELNKNIFNDSNQVLLIDKLSQEIDACSGEDLTNVEQNEQNPMYVIYTSGTTGKPKGVIQSSFNVSRLFSASESIFKFTKKDIWLLFHSCAFDFSVWEIWGALLHGGTLVIPTESEIRDPQHVLSLMRNTRVTVLNQTPSAFKFLLQEGKDNLPKDLAIRYIIFGGESLNVDLLEKWWDSYSDTCPVVVNMYGITEITVHATYKILTRESLSKREKSNIGKPLPDMVALVVDEDLSEVPKFVPGELIIGGNGLAQGYLNNKELTNCRFIEINPEKFIDIKQREGLPLINRFYRSGDIVRKLNDDSYEYIGRLDKQLKLNGYRIELEGIEQNILKHPDVSNCVVSYQEINGANKIICHYVLASKNKEISVQELKSFIAKLLPSYMIPSFFIRITEIPLTNNMKIDYKKLPGIEKYMEHEIAMEPSEINEVHAAILSIWEKCLNIENIKIDDNFFGLGGDSITSVTVVSQARELGINISISDIFRYQTVRKIVKAYDETVSARKPTELTLLNSSDRKKLPKCSADAYPMAGLQLGMIYHSETSKGTGMYIDTFLYKIAMPYDSKLFSRCLEILTKENPVLRTTFDLTNYSLPIQIVHNKKEVNFFEYDLREMSENEQEEVIENWFIEKRRASFNFSTENLISFTVFRVEDSILELGLNFHHAILDGWSVATLIRNLLFMYNDFLNGYEHKIVIDFNYKKHIADERLVLKNKQNKLFWTEELKGIQPISIPKWNKSIDTTQVFATCDSFLSIEMSENLKALSKQLNVSLDVLFMAALAKLLAVMTGNEDVVFGATFNGRPPVDNIDNTLGLFLNTLPFRVKLQDTSWEGLILSVSDKKAELYPYRRYPLIQICEDIKNNAIFDVLFYYTNFHVYEDLQELKEIRILNQTYFEKTNFPLVFNCSHHIEKKVFQFKIAYDAQIYSRKQIEYFSICFEKILKDMTLEKNNKHNKFIDNKSIQPLIGVSKKYNLQNNITKLIALQANQFPNKIAIYCGKDQLNYASLDERINAYSQQLKKLGVEPQDYIVVYTTRKIETIVIMLSILKLGAVFIPVDLSNPEERVEMILSDVEFRFICSHEDIIQKRDFLRKYSEKLLIIDYFSNSSEPEDFTSFSHGESDLAYVIYTSGSTGKPKGVMVKYASLMNLLFSFQQELNINPENKFLALTALSFDISLLELFLPLICGCSFVLSEQGQNLDPAWILDTINDRGIDVIQATPTAWKILFDNGYKLKPTIKAITGGEALTPFVKEKLQQSLESWNVYGPTETTIWSTCIRLSDLGNEKGLISIGKPIANTQVFVLNEQLEKVPYGALGEIFIGGLGVARGYLNNKDLTKAKFIGNPYNNNDFSKYLYKTGDMGYLLPDGRLYYVGRRDLQYKIRGYRVEAGEIENIIMKYPGIQDCCVSIKAISNTKILVAYIVLTENNNINLKKLRIYLTNYLPIYMIPEKFIEINHIPLNINGKRDYNALPLEGFEKNTFPADKKFYPLTEEQIKIKDIWKNILSIDDGFGIDDSFFSLGGNSILSLVTVHEINKQFSVDFPILSFIEAPSISSIAEKVLELQKFGNLVGSNKSYFDFKGKQIPDPIVKLKDGDGESPLFLIHPVGGMVFYYIPLVNNMRTNKSIYAIQDPGILMDDMIFDSLEEMADLYLLAIRKHQPNGPYLIAGSSFGANVAIAIAQKLIKNNEIVKFVGLIDGWVGYPDKVNKDKEWFNNNLQTQLQSLEHLLPEYANAKLLLDIHWHRQQLLAEHTINEQIEFKLTLFKAIETMDVLKSIDSPYNNWETVCKLQPKKYMVPGDHFTIHFEPNVKELAYNIDECLLEEGGASMRYVESDQKDLID